MADVNSFDVVSKVDIQEVKNALDQALKEIHQRFDFKGTRTELTLKEKESELVLVSDDEYKLKRVVVFVGVITLSGSYELFALFVTKAAAAAMGEAVMFYLDAALVGIVAALAVVILADSVSKWYGFVIQKKPFTTSEIPAEGGIKIPAGPCC